MVESKVEHSHCIREEKLLEHEKQIVELKAKANYKEKRIDELNESMHEMDKKLDDIKDTITKEISKLQMKSMEGDTDIDNRVTALENTVKVLKWVSATSISFLSFVIAALVFAMAHLH